MLIACFRGDSTSHWRRLDRHPDSRFFGFDTFTGLPEAWRGLLSTKPQGSFSAGGNVRELRVHDPANGEQHPVEGKGFLSTNEWHEILWEIGLARMRVIVDGDVRFEKERDYSGFESAPSVGPCFGSKIAIREFSVSPLS